MEVSGLGEMVDSFITLVSEQMALRAEQLAGAQGVFVRDSFEAVFAPEPIRRRVLATLIENYEAEHAQAMLTWFESDLGRRFRDEESAAQRLEAQEALLEFIAAMQAQAPNPDRVDIAVRIDRGRQASFLAQRLITDFMRGILRGTAVVATVEGPVPTPSEIDASVEQQFAQLGPVLQNQMMVSYLFMGRNLSLDENRRYLAQVESEAGQWFYEHSSEGLVKAMSRAGRAFGIDLAAHVQDLRAQAEAAVPDAEAVVEIVAQARAYAGGKTWADCVDEIETRRRACTDDVCIGRTVPFAETCFEVATASSGVCGDVPSGAGGVGSIFWRADRCLARGTSDAACSAAHSALQKHCEARR